MQMTHKIRNISVLIAVGVALLTLTAYMPHALQTGGAQDDDVYRIVGSPTDSADVSRHAAIMQHYNAKDIPAGNYSGIAYIGGNRYALVSDKAQKGGYHIVQIDIDDEGQITDVEYCGFRELEETNQDEEAVAYNRENHSIYIGKEGTSEITRYDILSGEKTANVLVDEYKTFGEFNRTIESLAYDPASLTLYTINEAPLKGDNGLMLRLMAFTPNLSLKAKYTYILDKPIDDSPLVDDNHIFGVAELTALGDGTLLVLEREFRMVGVGIGSWVMNKIFRIRPGEGGKQFVTGWRTHLNVSDFGFGNYEGMCLGPRLNNGKQVIILCADSQDRYMKVLRDWFMTVVI